jgi:hypothetical protein
MVTIVAQASTRPHAAENALVCFWPLPSQHDLLCSSGPNHFLPTTTPQDAGGAADRIGRTILDSGPLDIDP